MSREQTSRNKLAARWNEIAENFLTAAKHEAHMSRYDKAAELQTMAKTLQSCAIDLRRLKSK